MNTYVPLFLFLSLIGITAQEIKVKDHFDKKPSVSKDFSKNMIPKDSLELQRDQGLFIQFDVDNVLYCRDIVPPLNNPHSTTEAFYKLLKWNRSNCYNKNGKLVKKKIVFGMSADNLQETYYLNTGNTIERGPSIGDVLFTSSVEEIFHVLEGVGLNPNVLISPTRAPRFLFRKLVTPSGEFWEFVEKSPLPSRIAVLIDDKTKKVIAKTFDTYPSSAGDVLTEEYDNKRHKLYYPARFHFKMSESDVRQAAVLLAGGDHMIQLYPVSKKFWMVNYWKEDSLNSRGVMVIIDDETGKIVINSEEYSRDYLGEEKLKREVNQLLSKYKNGQ
ncbi:hypothetical protein N6B72_12405 [Chryseobacterium soli]|nr:hypothetical protein [Chryseobacterium soli]